MTKQQKLFASVGVFALVLILAITWFVRAPYATLQSIKEAAERRDIPELNRLIDFPSVKSSLKLMVMGSTDSKGSAGAGVARLFGGLLIGPVIEAMVTPESIAAMFSGKLPRKVLAAVRQDMQQGATEQAAGSNRDVTVTRNWDGLSSVRVTVRANGIQNQALTFVMRRDGLSWRLAAIEP